MVTLNSIERRVLAHLEQLGGSAHRAAIVHGLASPESRAARGVSNGSNGAVPLIMGKWCSRLTRNDLVVRRSTRDGYYDCHAITAAGRKALRSGEFPEPFIAARGRRIA